MNANPVAYLVLVVPAPPVPVAPGAVHVPNAGQKWDLVPQTNLLGREPAPDVVIVLPWPNVSKRHAQIEWFAPGSWEIEDLTSRNGTQVNGRQLQPNVLFALKDGDRIRIGSVELAFCFQLDSLGYPKPSDSDLEKWLEGPLLNGTSID